MVEPQAVATSRTSVDEFLAGVEAQEGLGRRLDPDQLAAVTSPSDRSLFLVAGPGSGKTTVLTLRILKLILVDGLDPASVLATTFTRKAAGELRSRIVEWGEILRDRLALDCPADKPSSEPLRLLDFNSVVTGTLDGIAQTVLTDFRTAGAQPPVPLEPFVAESFLLREGLWKEQRHRDNALFAYAKHLDGTSYFSRRGLLGFCREVRERFLHDLVDVGSFREWAAGEHPGGPVLCRVVADFAARMDGEPLVDFAGLEDLFRRRIEHGELGHFVSGLRAVLIDEYQDTNLLQEAIYFGLAEAVCTAGGSIAVVGDDDQSLYRFRGATVDLFRDFPERLARRTGVWARPIHLACNYRSTPAIVSWCSDFAELDQRYRPARVDGKPSLVPTRSETDSLPVLGMFRPTVEQLASDLAAFLGDVFRGSGVDVPAPNGPHRLVGHPDGDVGDCALLFASPKEQTGSGRIRLPGMLTAELTSLRAPIAVHNPRGTAFHTQPEVARLCGLMLECIDPEATFHKGRDSLPPEVAGVFAYWRGEGRKLIEQDPSPPGGTTKDSLASFVTAWQQRRPQASGIAEWPKEVPLAHLMYQLVAWLPGFQTDPLELARLEVIGRSIAQAAQFNLHRGTIERDAPRAEQSVRSALWLVFKPLAEGEVGPDEALVGALPRDKVNLLSIHQAKGLEFPLVVVDVGSEFEKAAAWSAFRRFPTAGSRAHRLEDELRPFSPIGAPRSTAVERAFDDLVRQYFVAFSRAQDALLVVGIGTAEHGPRDIPNVATGWTRSGAWPWRGDPRLALI